MASRAILSIHCEPQETDACRRFGGVSVSISASHGRVQNSWRQAFRFIKLTSTAAYGVREVVPYLDRCDRPLPRPISDGKGLGFTWIL